MALNNFRNQNTPEPDDASSTMCSAHGCPNRWAVQMEGSRPMCSKHQWQESSKPKKSFVDLLPVKSKKVSQWYDDKDEVY
jgi:hypothetical protein